MKTTLLPGTARGLRGVLAGVALALAGSAALTAWAQPEGAPHRGGGMHGAMFGAGPVGHVERMLDSVNASEAQRAQVREIGKAAAADLKARHETARALRDRQMALLAAPTIDANAVEAVRQQMLAEHDQTSRRATQAMIDISRVLTPEQRTQLAERTKASHEMMKRHRQERRQLEHPQG